MSFTKYTEYEYKIFEPGQLLEALKKAMLLFDPELADFKFDITLVHDQVGEQRKIFSEDDLKPVCDLNDNFTVISPKLKDNFERMLAIYPRDHFIQLLVKAPDSILLNEARKIISETLGWKEFDHAALQLNSLPNQLQKLENRIQALENTIRPANRRLKCFLSYRFNKRTGEYAAELTRFLELVEIEVVSGAGYEPRRITDKVKAKLGKSIDFVVYLVTKEGESAWTRDELASSFGKGYYLIPLVETGADFQAGMLGDWEYINFEEGHVGDAFNRILEAIRFIKADNEHNPNGA